MTHTEGNKGETRDEYEARILEEIMPEPIMPKFYAMLATLHSVNCRGWGRLFPRIWYKPWRRMTACPHCGWSGA